MNEEEIHWQDMLARAKWAGVQLSEKKSRRV
jgi:hypothetical protein